MPPERSSTGGWAMVVSATAPVAPGQELLLSYGERPNDDFFLHYGTTVRHDAAPHRVGTQTLGGIQRVLVQAAQGFTWQACSTHTAAVPCR